VARISRLHLTNFRNFADLELSLAPGVSVFFGDNAQGKTTLLEAVYLLAIARSFRAENEREVVNVRAGIQGEQSVVSGTVEKQAQRLSINVGYQSVTGRVSSDPVASSREVQQSASSGADVSRYSVRKEIRVNRTRRTATELVGLVGAVLFSADDMDLVYGPPAGRRRYLDILISQSDPIYIKGLQRYQRVVQQRNQLLRMLRDGRAEAEELEFWNDELVREGAGIIWHRHEAMRRLSRFCAEHQQQLSGVEEDFHIEYRPSVPCGESLQGTEERFRESLAAFHHRELATSATAVGPHRDDFKLLVNGMDMGTFASRGEARTLALSLRLGEASYLASARGDEPIVLLDDVLSEMDASRRQRVLDKIASYQQVLITTTDLAVVRQHFGRQATYFKVAGGQVTPWEE
jgi:DNA replication and repair protein RecF